MKKKINPAILFLLGGLTLLTSLKATFCFADEKEQAEEQLILNGATQIDTQPIKPLKGKINAFTQDTVPMNVSNENTVLNLSLDDVYENAILNNLEVQIEKDSVKSAGLLYQIAKGVYAPTISLGSEYRNDVLPVSSAIAGGQGGIIKNEIWSLTSSIGGTSPLGTEYKLEFDYSKTRTDNFFEILVPQYQSSLDFSVTQPLLKDFWINEDRQKIKILKLNKKLSEAEFLTKLHEVVYKSEISYWDLVLAYKNLDIKLQSLALAKEQLKRTIRFAQTGQGSKIEEISARAELEKRLEELAEAVDIVFRSSNKLRLYVSGDLNSNFWKNRLKPKLELSKNGETNFDVESALSESLNKRPEFIELEQKIKMKAQERKFLFNQTLPRADLIAEYLQYGLAGYNSGFQPLTNQDVLPVIERFTGGPGDAFSSLFEGDYRTVRVGMNLSWPVSPNRNRRIMQNNTVEMDKLRLEVLNTKQQVKTEVYDSINSIRLAEQRIRAAEASLKDTQTQLEGEIQRFNIGMSTNFLVLTRQSEYSEASFRLAKAITDYNKALSELKKAKGSILEGTNIEVKK
jgi:outer membrane protein TolC